MRTNSKCHHITSSADAEGLPKEASLVDMSTAGVEDIPGACRLHAEKNIVLCIELDFCAAQFTSFHREYQSTALKSDETSLLNHYGRIQSFISHGGHTIALAGFIIFAAR